MKLLQSSSEVLTQSVQLRSLALEAEREGIAQDVSSDSNVVFHLLLVTLRYLVIVLVALDDVDQLVNRCSNHHQVLR